MNKLLSAISLSKRAGKLLLGFDRVKDAVRAGKVSLVLTASDLSERSRGAINLVCEAEQTESVPVPVTMEELWYEIGQKTGILAVTDPGFAGMMKNLLTARTEKQGGIS